MTIFDWLKSATVERLDAELLLAFTLSRSREWLLAHDDFELSPEVLKSLNQLHTRRLNREPIAYILGRKEFYGHDFMVTPEVLIPRPETEQLVELCRDILEAKTQRPLKVLEVGTGSGCIAISLKLELPNLEITASDISRSSLKIARQNWKQLGRSGLTINFTKSDLLANISGKFDLIVANLPYLDPAWTVSPETAFEPSQALFAADRGTALIKNLVDQSAEHLTADSHLALELDPRSKPEIKKYVLKRGFRVAHELPLSLLLA